MRTILTCIIAVLSFSSCTKYVQMVTIKSDFLEKDSLLRYSTDTFEIVYNLFEENGLLAFSIYNKSNKPLYIDWKRSAFIKGEHRQVYWENTATFYSVTEGNSIRWLRDYSTSNHYSFGVISTPEQIAFIPPKTAVSMARFTLGNTIWNDGLKEEAEYRNASVLSKFKSKEFENNNSPAAFRNFLTLSLDHKFETEFYIDHSFWVSKITHMKFENFEVREAYTEETGFINYNYTYPFKKPNTYYNVFEIDY